MEGKSHYGRIEKIVGGTDDEKAVASKKLQDLFDKRIEKLSEYEIEISAEDLEILRKTETIVDRIVTQYGGEPKTLPLNNIHVLRPGSVLAMTDGRFVGGIHKPLSRTIVVEKGESKLLFASTIAHELFHLKSYTSARIGTSGEDVRLYRSGLSLIDRKDADEEWGEEKKYFGMLEEAIVAECTKKFLDEINTEALFSDEAESILKFRSWVVAYYRKNGMPEEKIEMIEKELKYIVELQGKVEQILTYSDDEEERQAYAAGMFSALCKIGGVETLERYTERKKLYELLDVLVVSSGGKFGSRDEIFDAFAQANFSGNYVPLARTIESILGKGSFRKLAEEFSMEPKDNDPPENDSVE